MALQAPCIQSWPFRRAPRRLKALFREGHNTDWVTSVPESLAVFAESHFERLRQLHPVASVRLPDGSTVSWGAPREAITLIAGQCTQPEVVAPPTKERRIGVRVPLACATRYETGSPGHKKTGTGQTIDMSSSGIFFTTQSLLRRNTRVALRIQWPVRLDDNVPVELFAEGKVVRTEQSRAALQYERIAFRVAPPENRLAWKVDSATW
jgi:hypothetical protein